MKRELRDELEVPGHVVMVKLSSRGETIKEIQEIISKYEKEGINKLRDLPQPVKDTLIKKFDLLGIPHDDLS